MKRVNMKSKERVKKHGEVFTPKWVVQSMCDTPDFKDDLLNSSFRVLEPAVGEGSFLVEILRRRLSALTATKPDSTTFQREALKALLSLYGVELLPDNLRQCRKNLLTQVKHHTSSYLRGKADVDPGFFAAVEFYISCNIVQGDFLTGLDAQGHEFVLPEWTVIDGPDTETPLVQRTDYTLRQLKTGTVNTPGWRSSPGQASVTVNQTYSLNFDDEDDPSQWPPAPLTCPQGQ